MKPTKQFTVAYFRKGGYVLLGYKKIGFGAGRWNGFGGSIEKDELPIQAAVRDAKEECGLIAKKLYKAGEVLCSFVDNTSTVHLYIFIVTEFEGELIESDEMRPQWFHWLSLPYENMWSGDKLWLDDVLLGCRVQAQLQYDNPTNGRVLQQRVDLMKL